MQCFTQIFFFGKRYENDRWLKNTITENVYSSPIILRTFPIHLYLSWVSSIQIVRQLWVIPLRQFDHALEGCVILMKTKRQKVISIPRGFPYLRNCEKGVIVLQFNRVIYDATTMINSGFTDFLHKFIGIIRIKLPYYM